MSAETSSPSPKPEDIRAYYNRFTAVRTPHYAKNGNLRIDKAIARILPLVREDSQVLEIGCGVGLVAEQIARVASRGFVSACDISDDAVAITRGRVKAANVQFRALDVGARFEDVKSWLHVPVDLVVMVDVVEHLPLQSHGKFFQELSTVMKPESSLVLTFPSPHYQRHLRAHRPGELQIIDEIIELPHLHDIAVKNGFVITHFSLEDVWLPKQYAHCILTRGAMNFASADQNSIAIVEIASLVPPGETFILVDQDEWTVKAPPERTAIPFLERDGIYWGPPPDDENAIRECERLRQAGARHIVFGWPAFWWLEHYADFHQHLRNRFPCVLQNERVVIFSLQNFEQT